MKNQTVADYYDNFYSNDQNAFNDEPLPLVKTLTEYLPSGKILEIGAGTGRNSLFLATKGYEVRAIDISVSAIERLAKEAKDRGICLDTAVSDIAEGELEDNYDAIICTFTFHHLTAKDAELAIRKMQQHTKPEGFNLITAFTKDGNFYKQHPNTENFYLENKQQLELLYKGWTIIKSFEREGKARTLDSEGRTQPNTFAGIFAQKI